MGVLFMSRKSRNITQQLNQKIDSLLRIGEKKIKDDRTNPNRAEGIHSIKTTDTYRTTARLLGDYLKQEGVRNIGDITREHIEGFMRSRENLSAYTHAKDLSAINKILDTRYTVRDFGLANRSYNNITNNRGLSAYDTSQAERNRQQLEFVRAIGMRRESIDRITPADFIRDRNGVCIGCHLIEKGGRERNAIILEQDRERITAQVNAAIQQTGEHTPFLPQVDSNANPHYCRAEYATQLYNDLLQAREEGRDYYQNMREVFINQEAFAKACGRYSQEQVHGRDRDTMAEVSQNLGHNRIDVVLYHYLK